MKETFSRGRNICGGGVKQIEVADIFCHLAIFVSRMHIFKVWDRINEMFSFFSFRKAKVQVGHAPEVQKAEKATQFQSERRKVSPLQPLQTCTTLQTSKAILIFPAGYR